MSDYKTSIPAQGFDKDLATKVAELLVSSGFRVVSRQDQRIELQGPGLWSTNQDPIGG